MEISVNSVFLSIAVLTLSTCAWRILNWVWLRPKKLERCLREQGFNVIPYKFLYGDTKEMISRFRESKSKPMDFESDDIIPHILPYHHHCINLHGNNYCIWMGPTPRVNISDPKLIREVLFNYEIYQKIGGPFVKLLMTGLVGYEGKKWVKHRNLLNPAFNFDKLKHMVAAINLCCSEMISKWEVSLSTKGSCELDVWPYLSNFSCDVISRTAFGSNYDEGKRIFQLQKEQIELIFRSFRTFFIPGWRFLPTKKNRRLKTIYDEIGAVLRDIINKKEKAIKAGAGANDLLGILLETNVGENQEQGRIANISMSIEEVIEECKLFYIAGQETTSSLLVWTMVLLSKHQKWQILAREEVLAVFGDDEPDFDGLNQLKIVTMILYEVLRLYPPAGMTTRRVHQKTKLGEFVLPAGVELSLPFISIHHNPNIWGKDAAEFKPERFSEGISKAANVQGTFLPFSGGPRICIGQNFAMMEAKIAIAMILQRFSFQLSPSYVHSPFFLVTLQPHHGAHLMLQKI